MPLKIMYAIQRSAVVHPLPDTHRPFWHAAASCAAFLMRPYPFCLPQEVVRATTTTTSIFSVKFMTYLLLGAGSLSDLPLYGVAIVAALIGLNIGNAIAQRLNQKVFSRVLLGVMLLSTALLYAASFGLTAH